MALIMSLQAKVTCLSFISRNVVCHSFEINFGVASQLQFVRERRRTSRPPHWFVERKTPRYLHDTELTPDNKDFLQQVVQDRYGQVDSYSPLKAAPHLRQPWTLRTRRTGVLAIKIGVVPQWTKDGKRFHTTLLQVLDNHVIRYLPPEVFKTSDSFKPYWKRYGSVVVGALSSDPLLFTKQYNNLFAEAGVPPKRKLTRFLVTPDAVIEPGTRLTANHFKVGDHVDVQAKTIGHGFQGVVKRWGFKGGPASHGTTKWHRRPGSIAGGKKHGVWKGKKMPGHMGMDWNILRGLKIWRINTKYNVLYVTGPNLPGPTHCYVRVFDSTLRNRVRERESDPPHMPTFYPEDHLQSLPEEIFHEDLFQFEMPSITFEDAASEGKS